MSSPRRDAGVARIRPARRVHDLPRPRGIPGPFHYPTLGGELGSTRHPRSIVPGKWFQVRDDSVPALRA